MNGLGDWAFQEIKEIFNNVFIFAFFMGTKYAGEKL